MSFERYVDYALDVPMYFARRDGRYVDCSGQSFRDFLDGKLPALPGERPAIDDWDDHLSTIFPEVRLKTFLEMRGADAGPQARLCALSALWTGVLYDQSALDAAWDLVKGWSAAEREAMRRSVPAMGLQTPARGGDLQGVAKEMLAIARGGLKRRAMLNSSGDDETIFLRELDEIAQTGVTPAERLLARFHGPWKRDVRPAFDEVQF
jgi:glutamate--cysteine ligase